MTHKKRSPALPPAGIFAYKKRSFVNMNETYTEINAQTFDQWVEEGWEWGQPISH